MTIYYIETINPDRQQFPDRPLPHSGGWAREAAEYPTERMARAAVRVGLHRGVQARVVDAQGLVLGEPMVILKV